MLLPSQTRPVAIPNPTTPTPRLLSNKLTILTITNIQPQSSIRPQPNPYATQPTYDCNPPQGDNVFHKVVFEGVVDDDG